MAVEFVNAGAQADAHDWEAGGLTLAAPSSPAVDDIWVAVVCGVGGSDFSMSGWTPAALYNDGTVSVGVFWHRYAGTTPNLGVTQSTSLDVTGGIGAFRGCVTEGDPFNIVGSWGSGSDNSIEHGSIAPDVDGCFVLLVNGATDNNARTSLPAGFTAAFNPGGDNSYIQNDGDDRSVALVYDEQASAGATGELVVTMGGATNWAGVQMALEPAGGGPSGVSGTGAATLPSLAAAGSGDVAIQGTGAAALPTLSASGEGATDDIVGTGVVALPSLGASGEGAVYIQGLGAATLPAFAAGGSGDVEIAGSGSAVLPAFSANGVGAVEITGSGSATLPALAASGFQTAPEVVGRSGMVLNLGIGIY